MDSFYHGYLNCEKIKSQSDAELEFFDFLKKQNKKD